MKYPVFELSVKFICKTDKAEAEEISLMENVTIETSCFPLEITSPGALRPARPGHQSLAYIIDWNLKMKFSDQYMNDVFRRFGVLEKLSEKLESQRIELGSIYSYSGYSDAVLEIAVSNLR